MQIQLEQSLDQTRKICSVRLTDTPAQTLGSDKSIDLEQTYNRSIVALSHEMIGGAQKLLESAIKYTKLRVQFGRSIGSFQAINSSSSTQIDVSNFEPEYDDKKTLAIVTGIEGTSKVLDNKNNECFPEWFNELEFEQIISLPIINGFETYGCIYIFLKTKNEGELLEKKLKSTNLLIKIFDLVSTGFPDNPPFSLLFGSIRLSLFLLLVFVKITPSILYSSISFTIVGI